MNTRPDELSESETEMLEAMKGDTAEVEEVTVVDEDDEVEAQEVAAAEESTDRDEKGRFKAKASEEAAEGAAEDPAPTKQVPLQALDSERFKRQEAEGTNADLRRQLAELQQIVAQYPQQQAPEQQKEEFPVPVVDPDGFRAWMAERDQRNAQPINQLREMAQQKQQVEQQMGQLRQYAEAHETHFKQEYPDLDYDGALTHARGKFEENLRLLGYSEQEATTVRKNQEAQVTALTAQRGINPAAYIYNYALANGFQPEQKPETEPGNISRLADAQRRTQSTASAGGAPRNEELSFANLANMSESDLAKLEAKDPDAFRKALGG